MIERMRSALKDRLSAMPLNVAAMGHETLFFALYLMVIAALLIKDAPRPVATEDKAAVAAVEKAPIAKDEKASPAVPQADDSSKRSETPSCEKELRRTADLLRFFANRIQGGEDPQSVVADMRQQEKKISAVCD
jgi:hypothetical protein